MIFLEGDLSQAESKVLFMLTGDPEMQRLARLPSWEWDGHTENMVIVGLMPSLADAMKLKAENPKEFKKRRHVGKTVSHGAQRDMRGARLSGNILKELDMSVTPEQCDLYLANYHKRYPTIRGNYFRDIRRCLMRDKLLVNTWGRRWDVRYDRLDDDLFREGYSFLPQSEVADHMNQRGVIPVYRYVKDLLGHPPNLQCHDSLLVSVPPQHAYDVAVFMRKSLERPILLAGQKLVIPVEFKLGLNWGASEKLQEGHEFARLPSREEFTEIAMALEAKRVAG